MRLHHVLPLCAALLWLPCAWALDVGDAAPALKGLTLDAKPFDLSALKGKVLVVNLWATWCGPCREEMPLLDAFARKYAARGVVLLGLDEDKASDVAAVKQAMTGFSYPALMAASAETDDFRMPRVLPVTYIIDASGVVRVKLWAGGTPVTEQNLEQAVEPLLH